MSLTPYVHLAPGSLLGAADGDRLALDADARSHLERVLRLRAGARLVVADGEGREAAAVLDAGTVTLAGEVRTLAPPAVTLHLVQALAKGRKNEDVIRAATELGVDRITIVSTQRSIPAPSADKHGRMVERWRAVALAAASQSRRARVPTVDGPIGLHELPARLPADAAGVIGHPGAEMGLRGALATIDVSATSSVVGAVGPEGGFDERDLATLGSAGLVPVHLGDSVLRTEHAGHALCAVLAFHVGRMD